MLTGSHKLAFNISSFDRTLPLVIDPVLDYSTYIDGSVMGDVGNGIAVDTAGDAYIVGTTFSSTLPPATNTIFSTPGAGIAQGAAFVMELDPTGSTAIYFTFLSGDTGEFGQGIAVDALGNAYVTGGTLSTNYPTTSNGFSQTSTPISNPSGTAFLTEINPTGTALSYSTLLGGPNGDFGVGVAADATGNAYVTGFTNSAAGAAPTLFTVQGGFDTTLGGSGNAFLIRIDTTQSGNNSLIYSTYLGGTGTGDRGFGVAVDALKAAYITGTTTSSDFPAKNAFISSPANVANGAAFVTKIDTTTTGAGSLVYSTYLDGPFASPTTNGDFGNAIALGPGNIAYVTGQTLTGFYVTTNSYQSAVSPSAGIAFVSLIDTTKTGQASVPYSAIIGGTSDDEGTGISVDTTGNAYVAGIGGSPDFPVTPGALQSTRSLTNADAFVLELNPGGHGSADLLYSTYFGGTNADTLGFALALDTLKNVYITGQTGATDFPVFSTGTPFQSSIASGAVAGFATKLTLTPVLSFSAPCALNLAVTPNTSCSLTFTGQLIQTPSTAMTFAVTNNTGSNITLTTYPPVTSGTNASDFVAAGATSGLSSPCSATALAPGASCGIGVTFTPTAVGAESAALSVAYTYNNGLSATAAGLQLVALSGTSLAPVVALNPAATLNFAASQPLNSTSAPATETVTNTGTGTLNITAAAAISGANAGDFAIAGGTTCTNGASVAATTPNSNCVIDVTFTPTALGARTAILTIADNASTSPQTITLTGTAVAAAPTVSLTPPTVSFGGQLVTTTATAQAVTVKNTGTATLNITATPALGGTNASDFAIASGSTCTSGAAVAPNGTCVINLTFTPPTGASGSRSATLSIADNAAGSPQTVTLSGTAWDFTISAQPVSVTRGTNGTIAVTVTGVGGFTGAVTLPCTASIPQGSCTAPASAVTATGTGNITIMTTAATPPPASRKTPPFSRPQVLLLLAALMFLGGLPMAGRFRTRLGLAGAAAVLIILAGCSSNLATQAGTYSVSITGTSGGVSHSAAVNVTVN